MDYTTTSALGKRKANEQTEDTHSSLASLNAIIEEVISLQARTLADKAMEASVNNLLSELWEKLKEKTTKAIFNGYSTAENTCLETLTSQLDKLKQGQVAIENNRYEGLSRFVSEYQAQFLEVDEWVRILNNHSRVYQIAHYLNVNNEQSLLFFLLNEISLLDQYTVTRWRDILLCDKVLCEKLIRDKPKSLAKAIENSEDALFTAEQWRDIIHTHTSTIWMCLCEYKIIRQAFEKSIDEDFDLSFSTEQWRAVIFNEPGILARLIVFTSNGENVIPNMLVKSITNRSQPLFDKNQWRRIAIENPLFLGNITTTSVTREIRGLNTVLAAEFNKVIEECPEGFLNHNEWQALLDRVPKFIPLLLSSRYRRANPAFINEMEAMIKDNPEILTFETWGKALNNHSARSCALREILKQANLALLNSLETNLAKHDNIQENREILCGQQIHDLQLYKKCTKEVLFYRILVQNKAVSQQGRRVKFLLCMIYLDKFGFDKRLHEHLKDHPITNRTTDSDYLRNKVLEEGKHILLYYICIAARNITGKYRHVDELIREDVEKVINAHNILLQYTDEEDATVDKHRCFEELKTCYALRHRLTKVMCVNYPSEEVVDDKIREAALRDLVSQDETGASFHQDLVNDIKGCMTHTSWYTVLEHYAQQEKRHTDEAAGTLTELSMMRRLPSRPPSVRPIKQECVKNGINIV